MITAVHEEQWLVYRAELQLLGRGELSFVDNYWHTLESFMLQVRDYLLTATGFYTLDLIALAFVRREMPEVFALFVDEKALKRLGSFVAWRKAVKDPSWNGSIYVSSA